MNTAENSNCNLTGIHSVKEFGSKANIVLLSLSIFGIVLSSLILLGSTQIFTFLAEFLSEKVFHRDFDIAKWGNTILSLISFPAFAVVFIDAVIFPKFSSKAKIILLSVCFFIVAFFIFWIAYFRCNSWIDDDMAAEISLAKECFINKTFMPRTWEYATEYRIVNNQLIAAPLFLFTGNWLTVKAITVFISSAMIPLTLFFLLNQIGIKTLWVKLFTCLVSYAPWTLYHWEFLQFGGYYIPHVALSFLTVGLFFASVKDYDSSIWKKFYAASYFALSVLNGMAGIRYLIQFHFPLFLGFFSYYTIKYFKTSDEFKPREFLIKNAHNFYSMAGLFACASGYLVNVFVLSKFFSIGASYNVDVFTNFGNIEILRWLGAIFNIIGYRANVSYTTPGGVNDILVYAFVIMFVIFTIRKLKHFEADNANFFILFSAIAFILNSFINIHVNFYKDRYFLTYIMMVIPCIAIFLEEKKFLGFYRYVFGAVCAVVFLGGTFVNLVVLVNNSSDRNQEGISKFLNESEYETGFSVYWTGLKMQFLTNGKIEFLNFYANEFENAEFGKWSWLASKRVEAFDYKHDQKTVLVLPNSQITKKAQSAFEKGKIVYNDEYYTAYEYPNKLSLKLAVDDISGGQ